MAEKISLERTKVVALLRERLAETERKRSEALSKQQDKQKKVRESIIKALEIPEVLVLVAGAFRNLGYEPADGEEGFLDKLKDAYDGGPYERDQEIKRLIRIYEAATNAEIEVSVHDSLFLYI